MVGPIVEAACVLRTFARLSRTRKGKGEAEAERERDRLSSVVFKMSDGRTRPGAAFFLRLGVHQSEVVLCS